MASPDKMRSGLFAGLSPEDMQRRREAEDLQRAKELPSTFTNRAFVRVWSGLTRITFGEQFAAGDPSVWSSSITLTTADALALADLIYEQYNQEKTMLEEMAEAAAQQAREDVLNRNV